MAESEHPRPDLELRIIRIHCTAVDAPMAATRGHCAQYADAASFPRLSMVLAAGQTGSMDVRIEERTALKSLAETRPSRFRLILSSRRDMTPIELSQISHRRLCLLWFCLRVASLVGLEER